MPLFELFRLTKARLESSQEKKSSVPEDDLVELLWQNGQLASQSQSRNSQASTNLASQVVQSKALRTKEIGNGSDARTVGALNEIPIPVPSHEQGLSQDDDLVPWLNQPLDESLQTGYGSDFFRDVSEVTANEQENEVTEQTAFPFFHTSNNSNQSLANSVQDESRHGLGRSRSSSSQSNLFQGPAPLCQNDRVRNVAAGHNTFCEESGRLSQKQVPVLPSKKPPSVNFSHFLRPAALAKASSAAGTSGSNHVETGLPVSANRLRKENTSRSPTKVLQTKIVSAKVQEDKVFSQSVALDPAKFVTVSCSSKNNEKGCQIPGNSCRRDQHSEKAMEPVVQCSSVCSGNSMEGPPDGPSRSLKRLHSDIQDMDYHSEDDEEELTDGGKVPFRAGPGSKRSRSAEVHNLSERRRRDRINEKMRALQELIPNCNKVDKASMLEEAIEHIKSLQLHIQNYQIMSMSSGYYMPPMMFPPGMQPMHAAANVPPHYAAMAMGMGMNYGMGMPDMSCVSPRVPMVQVPPQFQATGLQPFVRPGIVMPPVPGGFFMGSPREINGSAVTEKETNKDADQNKETGSKDQVKNTTLKPTQSSSCSNLPTKQVSDQVRGSS